MIPPRNIFDVPERGLEVITKPAETNKPACDIHATEYKLTLHNEPVIRTSWWKDEDRMEPSNLWWLTGGGLSRPATDAEVQFWKAAHNGCDKLGRCQKPVGHEGSCNTTTGA
jgi:hypothetical protein